MLPYWTVYWAVYGLLLLATFVAFLVRGTGNYDVVAWLFFVAVFSLPVALSLQSILKIAKVCSLG